MTQKETDPDETMNEKTGQLIFALEQWIGQLCLLGNALFAAQQRYYLFTP